MRNAATQCRLQRRRDASPRHPTAPTISRSRRLSSQRGSVTPFFAILLITILVAMLGSLDLLRVHFAQARLQNALDVAALSAGANLINYPTLQGTDLTNWETDAYAYLLGNFPTGYNSSTIARNDFVVTVNGSLGTGQTITLSAKATVPMLSFGFLPFPTDTISANNQVLRQNLSNLELVMALDNTGSMGSGSGSKMEGLRSAATQLVTLMFGDGSTAQAAGNAWIGLVPFASTVNMGGIASASNWFNTNLNVSWPKFNMNGVDTSAWGGCVVEPRAGNVPGGKIDIGPGDPKLQLFQKYYYNVPADGINVFSCASGTTYQACAGDTKTTPYPITKVPFVLASGRPNPNGDASNPFAPDDYSGLTKVWAQTQDEATVVKNNPGATGGTTSGVTRYNQNQSCITHRSLFMTSDQNALSASIQSMSAGGSTIIPQGLLWGWRMLSPKWAGPRGWGGSPVSGTKYLPLDPADSTNRGLQRVLIILTDGQNQVSGTNAFPNSIYYNGLSGVGDATLPVVTTNLNMPNGRIDAAEKHGNSPTDNSAGGAGFTDDLNAYQAALCTAIKADGVTVFAITFGSDASSSVAQQSMLACASGSDHYFHAPDNATLQKIFSQIAGGLSELRLIK